MRPRALASLLALTAGDYLLWHWSLTTSHDVLALGAGLTLLPLSVISLACFALSAARLVARGLARTSRMARSMGASHKASVAEPPGPGVRDPASPTAATASDRPSDRIAA